ncbi:Calmodulin-sensitive adenylate cyclase precursor [compost metagenome]
MTNFSISPCCSPSIACRNEYASEAGKNETTRTIKDIDSLIVAIKHRTGVVTAHLARLQAVAKEHNCLIAIRPVEAAASGLIEAGHPTKGFHIKGKSSNWGLPAGFIPVDQALSKLEKYMSTTPERVNKFNEQVEQCITDKHAVDIPLVVSRARIDYLLESGFINDWHMSGEGKTIKVSATGPSGDIYEFEGIRCEDGHAPEYRIFHGQQPLRVLAKEPQGKPLTADYDLLLIGPHLGDLGPQDSLPVPDVNHRIFQQRIDRYARMPEALKDDYLDPQRFYSKEDPDKGNITTRVARMIPILNQALVGEGEPVIHHSTDSSNPASDPAANYPATFFLPTKFGSFDEIVIVENSQELAALIQEAKNCGYHVPLNPLWEQEVTTVRRASFERALSDLQA